ncbi:MAG: LapA family protein [Nocardioides sp.]
MTERHPEPTDATRPLADGTPTEPVTPTDRTPGPTPDEPTSVDPRQALRGSRTSGLWAAVIGLLVVLVLLIVFIVQNTQSVQVSYFGWDGQVALSVALLIATASGLLIAGTAGTLRIWQLRRRVRRLSR